MDESAATTGGFQGVHAVLVRARDLETVAAFYVGLGLRQHRRTENVIQLDAGGSLVEIGRLAAGYGEAPEPASRLQSPVVAVLRVADRAGVVAAGLGAGGRELETLHLPTGTLTYLADPEGNVVGIREALPELDESVPPEGAVEQKDAQA